MRAWEIFSARVQKNCRKNSRLPYNYYILSEIFLAVLRGISRGRRSVGYCVVALRSLRKNL